MFSYLTRIKGFKDKYNMKENHKDERNIYIYNKPDEILESFP